MNLHGFRYVPLKETTRWTVWAIPCLIAGLAAQTVRTGHPGLHATDAAGAGAAGEVRFLRVRHRGRGASRTGLAIGARDGMRNGMTPKWSIPGSVSFVRESPKPVNSLALEKKKKKGKA